MITGGPAVLMKDMLLMSEQNKIHVVDVGTKQKQYCCFWNKTKVKIVQNVLCLYIADGLILYYNPENYVNEKTHFWLLFVMSIQTNKK